MCNDNMEVGLGRLKKKMASCRIKTFPSCVGIECRAPTGLTLIVDGKERVKDSLANTNEKLGKFLDPSKPNASTTFNTNLR